MITPMTKELKASSTLVLEGYTGGRCDIQSAEKDDYAVAHEVSIQRHAKTMVDFGPGLREGEGLVASK